MLTAKTIAAFLDGKLKTAEITDKSNNGLQVDNEVEVRRIGFAVDASLETFKKALDTQCQMLIVHHGIIWGGINSIVGTTYRRVSFLIDNQLALYASHLPLDLHPEYGNNIQLAKILKLSQPRVFGKYEGVDIGFIGETKCLLEDLKKIMLQNGMQTLSLDFGKLQISTVAIVSGGASDLLPQAVEAGADLFITGEPAHYAYHEAKENGINVIFGGHYETETWGVKALMPLLQKEFKVETEFLDVPTLL